VAKLPNLKSDVKVRGDLRVQLEQNAGITHWGSDSTARIFADVLSRELAANKAEYSRAFEGLQLSSATGADLDQAAFQTSGLVRKAASAARATTQDKNFYFYVQNQPYSDTPTATFGDINGGQDILVPAGTIVMAKKSSNESDSVSYRVDADVVLPADKAFAYAGVAAMTIGAKMNCSSNSLRFHEFSSYADSGFNALKCNNRHPILSGTDTESDESLRFRATQYIPSIVQSNTAALKLRSLSIPGIEELVIINGYFGIGTVAVVALGLESEVTPGLTRKLQKIARSMNAPGLDIKVIPGVRVYFDFDLRILTQRALSPPEAAVVRTVASNALVLKLKEFEIAQSLDFDGIAAAVKKSHPLIMGIVGRNSNSGSHKNSSFENIYVRKKWANSQGSVERQRIVSNTFTLKEEEIATIGSININITTRA